MQFFMYTKRHCRYCKLAKDILKSMGLPCISREVSKSQLPEGAKTYPQIFIRYKGRQYLVGGYTDLRAFLRINK